MNAEAIQRLVPELFRVIAELEAAAPGRHFTPDGHLIGSIGEVIAADRYGLTLTTASTKESTPLTPRGEPLKSSAPAKTKALPCVVMGHLQNDLSRCKSTAMVLQLRSTTVPRHLSGMR